MPTKKELADRFGVTKQTVTNYIDRLGLADHVTRHGQTDVLDDFAASAVADALAKGNPKPSPKTEADAVALLYARIDDLKETADRLGAQLDRAATESAAQRQQLAESARERERLQSTIDKQAQTITDLSQKLYETQRAQFERESRHWWQKLLGHGSTDEKKVDPFA